MSNAFANYSNLIAGLDAAQQAKNNVATTYHQTKAGIDSQLSILGDTKVFLSGKSGLEKASKNIIKPLWSKYGSTIKNKLRSAFSFGENVKPPIVKDVKGDVKATLDKYSSKPGNAEEAAENLSKRFKALEPETRDSLRNLYNDTPYTRSTPATTRGLTTSAEKEASNFAHKQDVANLGEEIDAGDEAAIGKLTTYENNRFANGGRNITSDLQSNLDKAKIPNTGTGPSEELKPPGRSGTFNTTSQEANAKVKPNLKSDGSGENELKSDLKNTAKKEVEEEVVEEGGEEAAFGVLDAIPFLDIAGVIGGAVLAGVEGHHAKKENEAELEAQRSTVNVNTQIGVSANEALNN